MIFELQDYVFTTRLYLIIFIANIFKIYNTQQLTCYEFTTLYYIFFV